MESWSGQARERAFCVRALQVPTWSRHRHDRIGVYGISGTPSLGGGPEDRKHHSPLEFEVLMPWLSERNAYTGLVEPADDLDQVNCQAA
jgi:hypothetical protein